MSKDQNKPLGFHLPKDPFKEEHRAIKARQKARKATGKPAQVTNDMLYEMMHDILENQARLENSINRLLDGSGRL